MPIAGDRGGEGGAESFLERERRSEVRLSLFVSAEHGFEYSERRCCCTIDRRRVERGEQFAVVRADERVQRLGRRVVANEVHRLGQVVQLCRVAHSSKAVSCGIVGDEIVNERTSFVKPAEEGTPNGTVRSEGWEGVEKRCGLVEQAADGIHFAELPRSSQSLVEGTGANS